MSFGASCRVMHHLPGMVLSVGLLHSAISIETPKNTFCCSIAAVLRAVVAQTATIVLDCDCSSPAKNLMIWWITGNRTTLYFWCRREWCPNGDTGNLEKWESSLCSNMSPGKQMAVFWSDFSGRGRVRVWSCCYCFCTFSFGFVLQYWHTSVPGCPTRKGVR